MNEYLRLQMFEYSPRSCKRSNINSPPSPVVVHVYSTMLYVNNCFQVFLQYEHQTMYPMVPEAERSKIIVK